jgi:tetratricopeptide (TPR) repeat protein
MDWKKEIEQGRKFFSEKDFPKALKCFETAVRECPVSAKNDLEFSLFFLGVTLKRLGKTDSALKCWHMGKNVKKDGRSIKMIRKNSNCYGMSRSERVDQDKRAFISIQLERYLKSKKVKRFCSTAERDVIVDIITSYWSEWLLAGKIYHLSVDEKVRFFKRQKIVFPVSDLNSLMEATEETIVYMNFQSGERQSMDEFCPCGSGELYSQCCGRIKAPEELKSEDF